MKILTGNDLRSGAVTWWNGSGWSPFVDPGDEGGEGRAEPQRAASGVKRRFAPSTLRPAKMP